MGLRSYPKVYFELMFSGSTLVMGMSLSAAFLPIFANELDPSGVLVGFTVSAWFFSRIFTELPSGVLAYWFGRRRLLVGGLAISTTGAFICSFADSIYLLILGRGLWGLGTALFFMSNTSLLLDLFKSSMRGRALGTFQSIEFIGSFIGAPIGAFIAGMTGYKMVFLSASVLMLCSSLVAFASRGLRQIDVKSRASSTPSMRDTFSGLWSWGLIVVCINTFSRMFVSTGIAGTVFPLFLNRHLLINVQLIGFVMSLRTAGLIVAAVTSGYLGDKFGRKPLIVLGILLQCGCLYLYTLLSSFEGLMPVAFLEGLGIGMPMTSLVVMVSEIVPPSLRGGAIGMYRTFMDIGGFLGPLFFMILFTVAGTHFPFFSAIVLLALNAGLMRMVKARKPTEDIAEAI